jgi:hypothetical protein
MSCGVRTRSNSAGSDSDPDSSSTTTRILPDEQFITVAVSTKEHEDSLALDAAVRETGGVPRESFVSPWAVHSPRIEDLVAWQGRVQPESVDRVVDALGAYIG